MLNEGPDEPDSGGADICAPSSVRPSASSRRAWRYRKESADGRSICDGAGSLARLRGTGAPGGNGECAPAGAIITPIRKRTEKPVRIAKPARLQVQRTLLMLGCELSDHALRSQHFYLAW